MGPARRREDAKKRGAGKGERPEVKGNRGKARGKREGGRGREMRAKADRSSQLRTARSLVIPSKQTGDRVDSIGCRMTREPCTLFAPEGRRAVATGGAQPASSRAQRNPWTGGIAPDAALDALPVRRSLATNRSARGQGFDQRGFSSLFTSTAARTPRQRSWSRWHGTGATRPGQLEVA